MNIIKVVLSLLACLGMGATFLPWQQTIFNGATSYKKGIDDGGWVSFGLFGLILLVSILSKWKQPLKQMAGWTIITIGLAIGYFAFTRFKEISQIAVVDIPEQLFHVETQAGIGLYLISISALGMIILPFLNRRQIERS